MRKILLIILIVLPLKSMAGVLIEPYAGYAAFQTNGTVEAAGVEVDMDKINAHGLMYGGRLGYGFAMVAAGLDFATGGLKDGSDEIKNTSMGTFFMVKLPIIRAWGTYVFSDKSKIETDDGDFETKGSGFKLGLGFSFLPLVSLNFEYGVIKIDDVESDLIDGIDAESKGFLVSLSMPIVF